MLKIAAHLLMAQANRNAIALGVRMLAADLWMPFGEAIWKGQYPRMIDLADEHGTSRATHLNWLDLTTTSSSRSC